MVACLSKMIYGICLITAVCTVLSSGSIPSTFISTVRNFVTTSWKRCETILPFFKLSQRFTSKDIFILFCLVITCFTMLYASVIAVGSGVVIRDRKSTRLNSSHVSISYAVFCLKKKNNIYIHANT